MQGMSMITPIKEVQIKGTVLMRLRQRKFQQYIRKISVFDIFCGDGENSVAGETIQGSPLEIADAINESGMSNVSFIESDINKIAVDHLMKELREKNNTNRNHAFISIEMSAKDALNEILRYLSMNKNNHAIVVVDPNGPADLPFDAIKKLVHEYSSQADLIMNVSETAFKRILKCRTTREKNWWKGYCDFIEIISDIMKGAREGWLRMPIKSDRQKWRFICCWSFSPPRNAWENQGLYRVSGIEQLKNLIKGEVYETV